MRCFSFKVWFRNRRKKDRKIHGDLVQRTSPTLLARAVPSEAPNLPMFTSPPMISVPVEPIMSVVHGMPVALPQQPYVLVMEPTCEGQRPMSHVCQDINSLGPD